MSVRRVLATSAVMAFVGSAALAGTAAADPPLHGRSAHSHHVHLGNGGCVDIDSVWFNAESHRGLHRGSEASGHHQGPYHGTCDGRIFPGGPFAADLGFPPHH